MENPSKSSGLQAFPGSEPTRRPQAKPQKPVRLLECPAELSPRARQEWDLIVSELTSKGVLSSFDRMPLAIFCNACAQYFEAMKEVQKYGAMIKSSNGYPVQSPYLSVANKHADTMIRIASEFGFTPASRSRIFSFKLKTSLLLNSVGENNDDNGSGW
jgi:P27 family predicted phage terminase small subunit